MRCKNIFSAHWTKRLRYIVAACIISHCDTSKCFAAIHTCSIFAQTQTRVNLRTAVFRLFASRDTHISITGSGCLSLVALAARNIIFALVYCVLDIVTIFFVCPQTVIPPYWLETVNKSPQS